MTLSIEVDLHCEIYVRKNDEAESNPDEIKKFIHLFVFCIAKSFFFSLVYGKLFLRIFRKRLILAPIHGGFFN